MARHEYGHGYDDVADVVGDNPVPEETGVESLPMVSFFRYGLLVLVGALVPGALPVLFLGAFARIMRER